MITDAILSIFIYLFSIIITILPSGGAFPVEITNAVTSASSIIHMFDAIVPMVSIINAILFLVTINLAIFAFWSIKFVINTIRGN